MKDLRHLPLAFSTLPLKAESFKDFAFSLIWVKNYESLRKSDTISNLVEAEPIRFSRPIDNT